MNTDGRNSLREAISLSQVHPCISVFIPVKPCDIKASGNAARGTRMTRQEKGDDMDGRNSLRGATFHIPCSSVHIRVHPGQALRYRGKRQCCKGNTDDTTRKRGWHGW